MTTLKGLDLRVTALEERVKMNEQAAGLADQRYHSIVGSQDVMLQILREQGAELQAIRVEHGAQLQAIRAEHGAELQAIRAEHGAMLRDHGGKLDMIVALINAQPT